MFDELDRFVCFLYKLWCVLLETKPNSSLRTNDAINRVADIAKKAGVINSLDDIESLHADVASDKKIGLKLQVNHVLELCGSLCSRQV